MKPSPHLTSNLLDGAQMRSVIALLAHNERSPQHARRRLDRLARTGALSPAQREAVHILFTLGAADVDRVLRAACADEDARAALRELRVHEARGVWLGVLGPAPTPEGRALPSDV